MFTGFLDGSTVPHVDGWLLKCDPLTALRDEAGICGPLPQVPVMVDSDRNYLTSML